MASSDMDFSSPVRPTWEKNMENAGKASLDMILKNATDDRYSSKKISKQLHDADGRPEVLRNRYMWSRRFQTFRKETLQADLTVAPTGEQLERFFVVIIPIITPRNFTGVPSYTTIEGGLIELIKWARFQFSAFKLTGHDSVRIKSLLKKFLRDGKLTKEPSRQKQWVGCVLVRIMVTTALNDAMSNGTANWDITISGILNILLLSSLTARSGDLVSSDMDKGSTTAFLNYNDIVLKLVNGKEVINLVASITIRNEKGYKETPSINKIVRLEALKDNENNILCPIRFLLILALRLGNVSGYTIDEVLSTACRRTDRTVKWIHGERPVMVAQKPSSTRGTLKMLQPEKPISQPSLRGYMQKIGNLAGLLARILPHDLRRGSGQDISKLRDPALSVCNTDVMTASALGHSYSSMFKGVTASYKGALNVDFWTKRVENAIPDPMGLQTAGESYKKWQRTTKDVDEICKEHGVDPSDEKARLNLCRRVDNKIKAGHHQAWVQKLEAAPSSTVLKTLAGTKRTYEHIPSDVLSERTNAQIDLRSQVPATHTSNVQPVEGDEDDDGQGILIDPALLALEETISGGGDQRQTDKMQDELITEHLLAQEESSTPTVFILPPLEFIRHFSSVNDVYSRSVYLRPTASPAVHAETLKALAGHSRNPPTPFLFGCENKSLNGCTYTHMAPTAVARHEATCKRQKEAESKRIIQCPQCPTRVASRMALTRHVSVKHNALVFNPRTCGQNYPGCDSERVFQNKREFDTHRNKYHSRSMREWVPMRCPVALCEILTEFRFYANMAAHLRGIHKQAPKPASFYIKQQQKGQ